MIAATQFGHDGAAIQTAINQGGGGCVYVEGGDWTCTQPITLLPHTVLVGDGYATCLRPTHQGSALQTVSQINGSTEVHTRVADLRILGAANGSPDSAGITDTAGTYVSIERVIVQGRGYGVVFNQTEIASIADCHLETDTAGVWLVNKDEVTPGANGESTNRITVVRCQLNGGQFGIVDDGGDGHVIRECNFNGAATAAVRAAGVRGLRIADSDFEGNRFSIWLDSRARNNEAMSQCIQVCIDGNELSHGWQPRAPILCFTGGPIHLRDNLFSGSPKQPSGYSWGMQGTVNSFRVYESGNVGDTGYFRALDSKPAAGSAESWDPGQ